MHCIRQCIASGSAWHQIASDCIRQCVASGSGLHQSVYCIRQCVATDSTSHQAAYCISAEQCVTAGPRVNGEQRIASELSSALHQTVYCIRKCMASDRIRQCVASGSRLHQTVRRNRQYIASGSVLYQCRATRQVSTKSQWRAAHRIK